MALQSGTAFQLRRAQCRAGTQKATALAGAERNKVEREIGGECGSTSMREGAGSGVLEELSDDGARERAIRNRYNNIGWLR